MENCYLCFKEFKPIIIPIEPPEILGIKPPHRTICPSCFLKGTQDTLRFTTELLSTIRLTIENEGGNSYEN